MTCTIGFSSIVIVAGGKGTRMGRPKQLLPLAGKPILVRTVEAFKACPCVKEIVVVTPEENQEILKKYAFSFVFLLFFS